MTLCAPERCIAKTWQLCFCASKAVGAAGAAVAPTTGIANPVHSPLMGGRQSSTPRASHPTLPPLAGGPWAPPKLIERGGTLLALLCRA